MKKLLYFVSAIALMAGMTACDNGSEGPVGGRIENGFYVIGEAVGFEEITSDALMAAGINEVDKTARAGLWERYAYIEAGKDFELVYYNAGETTRYGSNLDSELDGTTFGDLQYDQDGDGVQDPVKFRRGELIIDGKVEGQPAPALQVAESGFYYIALDLNEGGDLAYPQILVCPAVYGVRGGLNGWGWTKMEETIVDSKNITWTLHQDEVATGDFKFSFGGGWKIQLDDAGKVKLETNLGVNENGLASGADNIKYYKATDFTLTLKWTAKGGAFKNSFSYEIKSNEIIENPAEFVVGFSGGFNGWGDPTPATYNAEASNVTNTTDFTGTHVYDLAGFVYDGSDFKVRVNGGWFGGGNGIVFEGVTPTGSDNLTMADGTYDVRFTIEWKDRQAANIKVTFTQK